MTVKIEEGNLKFFFEFDAIKFDDSQYYQKHFKEITNNIKAVDILAVNNSVGYLIEIKDYTHPKTKPLKQSDLIEAIICKVISTLAAILPMKIYAANPAEREIANLFSKISQLNIILHIEQSPLNSKIKQSLWNPQHIQIKLKERLKPIDAHPKVVSKENLKGLPWTVTGQLP